MKYGDVTHVALEPTTSASHVEPMLDSVASFNFLLSLHSTHIVGFG